jgi:predicted transcriptional regulator
MAKVVKPVSVALSPKLVKAADRAARADGTSRSQYIARAIADSVSRGSMSDRKSNVETDTPGMARCPAPPPSKPQPSSTPGIGQPYRPLRERKG